MFRLQSFASKSVSVGVKFMRPVPKCQFGTYKTSTGLVGLAVDPNGDETLKTLATQVLTSVQRIPAESAYRVSVEKWFKYISKSVDENRGNIKAIEDAVDLGQIEEVIQMAKEELELVDFYYENKGWELVAEAKKTADENVRDLGESFLILNPEARKVAEPAK